MRAVQSGFHVLECLIRSICHFQEEIHPNRHEYDHEREVTQVWKGPGEGPSMSTMETDGVSWNMILEIGSRIRQCSVSDSPIWRSILSAWE